MTQQLQTSNFLFSIEATVFAVLAFLLWMYYRSLGRQYVKFWLLCVLSLSSSYLSMALQPYFLTTSPAHVPTLLLTVIEQIAKYLALVYLCAGIYSAKAGYTFSFGSFWSMTLFTTAFAALATLSYAFSDVDVFNRFYLRVSLLNFIYGCGLLASSLYLLTADKQHFSSRVMMVYTFIVGLRYTLFSFASIIVPTNALFIQISHFSSFFDIGANTALGFIMLIWMHGAERNATVSAINSAQYLRKHDSLTGALNREQVLEKLPLEMQKTLANKAKLCIFLIDIKRFKFINDTFGLKTGDYILGEVASRMSNSILMPCVVGRLSGDSFLFAAEIQDQLQVEQAITHIHQLVSRSYHHNNQELNISCSLGYCFYPDHGDEAEELLRKANLAVHHAETEHKASVMFDESMQNYGRQLMQMEKDIRRALANHEFILHFQPQLNLLTNKLEGVEALIRWQHPEKGLLSPIEFLGDVEALGLNSELDNYVLEKSCQTIACWHQQYKRRVTVAINITSVEFQDPKLISKIQALLFKYDIPPKYLDLEITENVVMTDIETAANTIVTLQNMGIKVSIDDFGTGYSSLSYLRSLPIDKIKIDRSFIREVTANDSDLTIVKSMIDLGHGLGKRVLAEGVETAEQLSLLRNIGCDVVQGYLISRPVNEQAIAKYLQRK